VAGEPSAGLSITFPSARKSSTFWATEQGGGQNLMSLDSISSRANEPGLTHGLALTGCRQRSITPPGLRAVVPGTLGVLSASGLAGR